MEFKEAKRIVRAWVQRYPQERLCALLAHAQDGKLSYRSCCCFIGVETADHALRSACEASDSLHYEVACGIAGSNKAEFAFWWLASNIRQDLAVSDAKRRRILIPIIRAELRRRERAAPAAPVATERVDAEVAR